MKIVKMTICLLIYQLIFTITTSFAQYNNGDCLVFAEVFLDKNQKSNSWVEIYNPTDKPLILEKFRLSNVRTLNMLPDLIRKEGGIVLEPNEYIVLCADDSLFKTIWGNRIKSIMVRDLAHFDAGGFIALKTKSMEHSSSSYEGFRYGNPDISKNHEKYLGNQVVPFSEDGKSYSREILYTVGGEITVRINKSVPTPGKK